jgi:hypothetical protein
MLNVGGVQMIFEMEEPQIAGTAAPALALLTTTAAETMIDCGRAESLVGTVAEALETTEGGLEIEEIDTGGIVEVEVEIVAATATAVAEQKKRNAKLS